MDLSPTSRAVARLVRPIVVLALSAMGPALNAQPASTIPDRASLAPPDSLWSDALSTLGWGDRPLGFTAEQMSWYGGDRYRLRTIGLLSRDIRSIPRYSGQLAQQLVAQGTRPATVVRIGFGLTDVAAGRFLPLGDSSDLGIPGSAGPAAPIASLAPQARRGSLDPRALELPVAVQRLVVRVVAGAIEAGPWLARAVGAPSISSLLHSASIDSVYRAVIAPWLDERQGQAATYHREALELPGAIDREYLAFASAIFLTHLTRAIDEYRATPPEPMPRLARPIVIATAIGEVRISGAGSDTLARPVAISIDLGGDDLYLGRQAVGFSPERPIAALVDLAGNDRYDATDAPLGIASGVFGIGVLEDLAGDDDYRCRESGLGAAWYGTGVLLDDGGNDHYTVDSLWGQGVAHVGVGALVDGGGNDEYVCAQQSQGMGATLGAGILLDVAGDDIYLARDDGNPSELYLGQSVAMAQGCGYGRRADLGDGHSLAGGFGVLVDGAGNDSYHATAWSQGCGYWWGAGFLEDLGGDDSYRNGKYSSGAAAHFAIGLQSDLSGNDRYNVGNIAIVNQFQGHARDGSIGISIDGDGNDHYRLARMCGGSGDLASIGFFWDRRGDDTFDLAFAADTANAGWNDTPPLGNASSYPPSSTFRDDIDAVGLFIDGGGKDLYRREQPFDAPGRTDGTRWLRRRDAVSRSLGIDYTE
jgi:hypothetical protein